MKPGLIEALHLWMEDWHRLMVDDLAKRHPSLPAPQKPEPRMGKRWIKVVHENAAWAFVDPETGDIYYPASWNSPAKHVRGNVFNQPMKCCGPYGVKTLR